MGRSTVGTLTFDLNAAAGQIALGLGGAYLVPSIIAGVFYLVVVYAMVLIVKLVEGRLRRVIAVK